MEVKVWMDGIQRVVCGVTNQTTCRDVMIAIAHATGKTGRYTMIEKWMETERNLSAADYPLQILQKWGEYATDIQFILRHSSLISSNAKSDLQSEKILNRINPRQESRPVRRKLKKSLTFNGASCTWPLAVAQSLSSASQNNGEMHINHSLESSEQSSIASHSSTSISPYPSLERQSQRISENKLLHDVYSKRQSPSQSLNQSLSNQHSAQMEKSTPHSVLPSQKTVDIAPTSHVTKPSHLPLRLDMSKLPQVAHGRKQPMRVEENHLPPKESSVKVSLMNVQSQIVHATQRSSDSTSVKSPMSKPSSPASGISFRSSALDTSSHNLVPAGQSNQEGNEDDPPRTYQENLKKFRKLADEQKNSSAPVGKSFRDNKPVKQSDEIQVFKKFHPNTDSDKVSDPEEKENLVKLVSKQKSEIESQGSQLASLNTEIYMMELDLEEDDRQLQTLSSRLEEIEALEKEMENEIQELELVSWKDKLSLEKQKETRIRTEITLLQSSIAKSEAEISKLENRIILQREEIEAKMQANKNLKESKEKNIMDVKDLGLQLEGLKSNLNLSNQTLNSLEKDATTAEKELSEKLSQLQQLEDELKQVNAELFHLQDENEDRKEIERLGLSRPGSLRKLDEMRSWSKNQDFGDMSNHHQGYLV